MRIVHLKIENFRGIKSFEATFDKPFICLVGRGDRGKSTILEAISYVLSGGANIEFYDSDFFNCDTSHHLIIEATISEVPAELLREDKFGLYIRQFNGTSISDDIENVESGNEKVVLTVELQVDASLEPKWNIKTNRPHQEAKSISWNDRSKIKAFFLNDYQDKQFSWTKGYPLYSLLRLNMGETKMGDVFTEAIREFKTKIDTVELTHLQELEKQITEEAALLGVSLGQAETKIDFKDIAIKENRLCFHDGNIPFRLKGKGTKRLLSIAIQKMLLKQGGIAMIDEVEQGLEPDRVKQLIRILKRENGGQLFVTTHSPSVIEELPCEDIVLIERDATSGVCSANKFSLEQQAIIRVSPEALYAKKIIVCEGKTEMGLCRAIDLFLQEKEKTSFSNKGTIYINGDGDAMFRRLEQLNKLNKEMMLVCDSDKPETQTHKQKVLSLKIPIFDCENGNNLEKQIIKDSPREVVSQILQFVSSLLEKYQHRSPEDSQRIIWKEICHGQHLSDNLDNINTRAAIAKYLSTENGSIRLKTIESGEGIGMVICHNLDSFSDSRTKRNIEGIMAWVKQ